MIDKLSFLPPDEFGFLLGFLVGWLAVLVILLGFRTLSFIQRRKDK